VLTQHTSVEVCLAEEAAMAITESEVVTFIKDLRLSELKPLIQALERELGVSAQTPVFATNPPRPVPPPAELLYDVVLIEPGPRRIDVLRALREVLGLGLQASRELADRPYAVIREEMGRPEAEALAAKLEAAGARVERRPRG
jgi:large subunit ribosomal protein L7/L12